MSRLRLPVAAAAMITLAAPAHAGWIQWGNHWGGNGGSSGGTTSSGGTSSSGGTTSGGGTSSGGATPVPEPSDLALFGMGVAGLMIGRYAARARRNRRD